MTAKRLIDNGKWVLWVVGFLASAVFTLVLLWGRSASCSMDDNRKGIASSSERIRANEVRVETLEKRHDRFDEKLDAIGAAVQAKMPPAKK